MSDSRGKLASVHTALDDALAGGDVDAAVRAFADVSFIDVMEDLGLLGDLDDELPPGFTAIFEIARVLEDPTHEIAQALSPAFAMTATDNAGDDEDGKHEDDDAQWYEVEAGEEYEAEFIRTLSDVPYVYAWQHLLPEQVFMRRLSQRRLWFPMPKTPRIEAVQTTGDGYSPNAAKQKVVILLDTSASMAARYRFVYSKAVVLHFLRRNLEELGHVFLRTFDTDVGPLETAQSRDDYDRLMRHVARQKTLGNGTCMEKAILTACADIRRQPLLTDAEILLITDGAAHLNVDAIEEALGEDIHLHCVKIGDTSVWAPDWYVDDALEMANTGVEAFDRTIRHVNERRAVLEAGLADHPRPDEERMIRQQLRELDARRAEVANNVRAGYGHEIKQLADVYVEVPDLDARRLFALDPDRLKSLREMVARMLAELATRPTSAESLKRAAAVLAHLQMLADEQADGSELKELDELVGAVEAEFAASFSDLEERVLEVGMMSRSDRRDLQLLLGRPLRLRRRSLWRLIRKVLDALRHRGRRKRLRGFLKRVQTGRRSRRAQRRR